VTAILKQRTQYVHFFVAMRQYFNHFLTA